MAVGYSTKVIKRLQAAQALSQYDVVTNHSVAGYVDLAGASEKPYGIAMEDAASGAFLDVVVEGTYFAVAAEEIAVGADVSCAASGEIRTAISLDTHTLGRMGPTQAAAVTNDLVAVDILKNTVQIA